MRLSMTAFSAVTKLPQDRKSMTVPGFWISANQWESTLKVSQSATASDSRRHPIRGRASESGRISSSLTLGTTGTPLNVCRSLNNLLLNVSQSLIPNIAKPHRGSPVTLFRKTVPYKYSSPFSQRGNSPFLDQWVQIVLSSQVHNPFDHLFSLFMDLIHDRHAEWRGWERCKFNLFSSCSGCFCFYLCILEPQNAQHKCNCCDKFYEWSTLITWGTCSFKVFCVVCNCSFNIENDGKSDINQDILTAAHERCRISSIGIKYSEKIMHFFV